jgi:hypothetical protein
VVSHGNLVSVVVSVVHYLILILCLYCITRVGASQVCERLAHTLIISLNPLKALSLLRSERSVDAG